MCSIVNQGVLLTRNRGRNRGRRKIYTCPRADFVVAIALAMSPENFAYVVGFIVPSQPVLRWRHAAAVVTRDGRRALLTVDMSNPGLEVGDQSDVPRDTIHLFRSRFACADTFYETVRVTNHGTGPATVTVSFRADADFADIFEVRGMKREKRGEILPPEVGASRLTLRYRGLDDRVRSTVLRCRPKPERVTESQISYEFRLGAKESREIQLTITCRLDGSQQEALTLRPAGDGRTFSVRFSADGTLLAAARRRQRRTRPNQARRGRGQRSVRCDRSRRCK